MDRKLSNYLPAFILGEGVTGSLGPMLVNLHRDPDKVIEDIPSIYKRISGETDISVYMEMCIIEGLITVLSKEPVPDYDNLVNTLRERLIELHESKK